MTDYGALLDIEKSSDPVKDFMAGRISKIGAAYNNNDREKLQVISHAMAGIVLSLNINRHVFKEFVSIGYGVSILNKIFAFEIWEEPKYGDLYKPLELGIDNFSFKSARGIVCTKKYIDISIRDLYELLLNYEESIAIILKKVWQIEKSVREAKALDSWINELAMAGCPDLIIYNAHS